MKPHTILRGVGVVAIVAAYITFTLENGGIKPLTVAVVGIVAIVAPEVIDQLPFGPSK